MTHTWNILNTLRNPETGYIQSVDWEILAEQDGYTLQYSGTTNFEKTQEDQSIIPFTQVTKENIVEWLESSNQMNEIVQVLLEGLQEIKRPQPIPGLPWD
jgi:hypothetical protein